MDDEPVEQVYTREGRWDELVALLIERAEESSEPWEKVQNLVRAALIYETRLDDADKAFLILETAFLEDFGSEEVARELARVTQSLGRWPTLLADCDALVPQLPSDERRVDLLLTVARFHEKHLRDLDATEKTLTAALAFIPDEPRATRALADLYGRRGEWLRAAALIVRLAEAALTPVEKVRLHLEAGTIYQSRLGARTEAAEQYRKVLASSPGNAIAAEALAEIAWEAGDRETAAPLLESLLPQLEGRSRAERAVVHRRVAQVAAGSDPGKAREHFVAAHELDPQDLETVNGWAELAWAQKWWEDVRALCEVLLARPEAGLSGGRKADCLERLGRACLALGEPGTAADILAKGLEIAPNHRGCREAAIEAYDKLGDHKAVVHHQRALVSLGGTDDDRFERLVEIARRHRDQGKDPAAALKAFNEAVALRPGDRHVLHEMLDLLTAAKQWKQAAQVLETISGVETGKARARYLVARANILNYELRAVDEAVDLYEQALDEDPDDLKTFERIDKILTAKRAWRDEARSYRRMIKRLGSPPPPEKTPTLLLLWKGLAEIYRTRLTDHAAAAAAYEVCAQLDPSDATIPEILAELFELQGPEGASQAARRRTELLERASTPDELARQLRSLRRLYFDRQQLDKVLSVCAALVASGLADEKERGFYDRYANRPWPRPRGALSEDLWQRFVYHPRQDKRISQVLAAVGASVTLVRAKEAKAWGLDERRKVPVESDPSLVSRILVYAGGLLGIPRPALYVHPDVPGEIDLANVLSDGQLIPSFVVGRDLTKGRSEREVAFVVGKRLALLRIEHRPLWPHVVPSLAELRVVLVAALKMFQPQLAAPEADHPALKQYQGLFAKTLPPHALEPLMAVAPALAQELPSLDVGAWAAAADQTANRAGLLVCGDLIAALRVLVDEARAHGTSADEAVRGLIRWSVSLEHLALREQLGLGVDST